MPHHAPSGSIPELLARPHAIAMLLLFGTSGCKPSAAQQNARKPPMNRVSVVAADGESANDARRHPGEGAPGEWWLPSGNYANTRYSSLDGINTANVDQLRVVTSMSTGTARSSRIV